jgi:Ni/Co efflux regulator RcnB
MHVNTTARAVAGTRRRPVMAVTAACTALLMALSTVGAQAQPREDKRSGQGQPRAPQMQPRQAPAVRPGPAPMARPGPAPMARPPMARPGPGPVVRPGPPPMRGSGPDRRWMRGDRLPPAYRTNHYVVNDWRVHHLSRPPRGYHWVQYGSDYLLVAIATGVIMQLILAN